MTPRFETRRIGAVNIFEIHGSFAAPWLQRMKTQMTKTLQNNSAPALLLNVREVETMDDPGAETALKFLRGRNKGAILGRNLPAYFIAEHMAPNESIPIFENSREAVEYFGPEFATGRQTGVSERRNLSRVKTAFPVEFEMGLPGETIVLEAVVTNLSEGGLFAFFLEKASEDLAHRLLDPFDLKMMKIRLALAPGNRLDMEGKILRSDENFSRNQGLAVAFYNVPSEDRARLQGFIKEQGKHQPNSRRKK